MCLVCVRCTRMRFTFHSRILCKRLQPISNVFKLYVSLAKRHVVCTLPSPHHLKLSHQTSTETSAVCAVSAPQVKTPRDQRAFEDARLTDEELDDFFDVCKLALQQALIMASRRGGLLLLIGTQKGRGPCRFAEAAPDFDMEKLETEAERKAQMYVY